MTHAINHKRATRELVRDLAIYVAIGVTLVVGIGVSVVYVPEKYWISGRWVGLVFATLIIFGYVLASCKRFWRRSLLWLSVAAVLLGALHLLDRSIKSLGDIQAALVRLFPGSRVYGDCVHTRVV